MRPFAIAAIAVIALGGAIALAQNVTNPAPVAGAGAYNSSPPTCTSGQFCFVQTDVNGRLLVSTGGGSATQDVNLTQILGAAPSATNPIWVSPATASTPWAITGTLTAVTSITNALPAGTNILGRVGIDQTTPGTTNGVQINAAVPAGTNIIGRVGIDQTTPGTTNLVSAAQSGTWTVQPGNTANTTPWLVTPTPSSASGAAVTSASSTAAASNLVLKASEGNLYHLTATIGATSGYLMLFDATSLPSNGAVTPVYCAPVTSNGTNGFIALEFSTPKRFGTGITAGFSTTGCFTLTASATGNFFGGYQ